MEAVKSLKAIKTIDDSIAAKTPQMSLIKREKGEKYTLGYLKLWLIYLQGNLNVKNKLSEDMIDLTAQTILDDFWWITLSDVKNIVTDALMGRYGEFYESLGIPKIISWFDSYSRMKFSRFTQESMSNHGYTKNDEAGWKERTRNHLTDKDLNEIDQWMNNS